MHETEFRDLNQITAEHNSTANKYPNEKNTKQESINVSFKLLGETAVLHNNCLGTFVILCELGTSEWPRQFTVLEWT